MSLYDRAAIIPGRSMTRSKAPDRLLKAWAVSGWGAMLMASNGREYLDLVCGLGAISLGYGETPITTSGVYSLPHECEIEAAEAVLEHVAPWASSVRFTKTGSEATHAAYRIAKAATGRPLVLGMRGAYHGWHEWCSPFLPLDAYSGTGGDVAALIVEPSRFGEVEPAVIRGLRQWCDSVGALLVFDSMLYGGRWRIGGASEYFGVTPDLECFGKAFGNGEAVAFIVGREALAEHGEMVSGTFSGDATGLSAVCQVIERYRREPVIETLWERGRQLQAGLLAVLPPSFVTIDGAAPLTRLRFVNDADKIRFKDAMHAQGILTYPDWLMTMFSHTPAQIDQVIQAAQVSYMGLR